MPRARRNLANSAQGLVEAAQAAAAGDIEPPDYVKLRARDLPHWVNVTRARARKEWTRMDLSLAAMLARCLADIERLTEDLETEGDVLMSSRGTPVANPKHMILETHTRRALALQRQLQVQPASTGDMKAKTRARSAEERAREAHAQLAEEASVSDLIPTA